jgi:tetratricopeptide (TPR) repeat protein
MNQKEIAVNQMMKWCLVGLTGLVLGGCVSGDRSLAQLKADGNALYAQGHYDAALSKYDAYLVRKPDSVEVRQKIAQTLRRLERPADAQVYMRTVYDVDPTRLEHAVNLAGARVEAGDIGGGLDFLRRYLNDHPTAQGYYQLAELAAAAGLPDDALRAYKVAEKLDGVTDAEPHRRLARFYQDHDLMEEATRQWRMVLWFDDADAEAGAALRALGHVPGPSFAVHPGD